MLLLTPRLLLPSRPVARRKAGTPAAEVKIAPQPLTPAFLQRAPQINATTAEAVVAALRDNGYLGEVRGGAGGSGAGRA